MTADALSDLVRRLRACVPEARWESDAIDEAADAIEALEKDNTALRADFERAAEMVEELGAAARGVARRRAEEVGEMKDALVIIGVAAACAGVYMACAALMREDEQERSSGSARDDWQDPAPSSSEPAMAGTSHSLDVPPAVSVSGESGRIDPEMAPTSGEPDDRLSTTPPLEAIVRSLSELDPGMEPTAEGLYSFTTEQWSQLDGLTVAEALDLMHGNVEGYDLTGHALLLERLGGLPTQEDCVRALEDREAQELLTSACTLNAALAVLEFMPHSQRGSDASRLLEQARDMRNSAERALMRRLEDVTGYGHWLLLREVFERWSRP